VQVPFIKKSGTNFWDKFLKSVDIYTPNKSSRFTNKQTEKWSIRNWQEATANKMLNGIFCHDQNDERSWKKDLLDSKLPWQKARENDNHCKFFKFCMTLKRFQISCNISKLHSFIEWLLKIWKFTHKDTIFDRHFRHRLQKFVTNLCH